MPRMPRHQSDPGAMRPGSEYHVTSRAVATTALVETPRDYPTFLSQLAEQCRVRELLVHPFCPMTSHVRLQLEARRGQISQAMSIVKSLHARYYKGTGARAGGAGGTDATSTCEATVCYPLVRHRATGANGPAVTAMS